MTWLRGSEKAESAKGMEEISGIVFIPMRRSSARIPFPAAALLKVLSLCSFPRQLQRVGGFSISRLGNQSLREDLPRNRFLLSSFPSPSTPSLVSRKRGASVGKIFVVLRIITPRLIRARIHNNGGAVSPIKVGKRCCPSIRSVTRRYLFLLFRWLVFFNLPIARCANARLAALPLFFTPSGCASPRPRVFSARIWNTRQLFSSCRSRSLFPLLHASLPLSFLPLSFFSARLNGERCDFSLGQV